MKSLSLFAVVVGLFLGLFVSSEHAFAGAGGGTGTVSYKKDDSGLLKELKIRHDLGLDYALDNKKFKSLVENFALRLAISAGIGPAPAEAKAIASTIISSIRMATKAESPNSKGLDVDFALSAIENVSTAVVRGYCPSCGIPIGVGKIATSFVTGYIYGFIFGI